MSTKSTKTSAQVFTECFIIAGLGQDHLSFVLLTKSALKIEILKTTCMHENQKLNWILGRALSMYCRNKH